MSNIEGAKFAFFQARHTCSWTDRTSARLAGKDGALFPEVKVIPVRCSIRATSRPMLVDSDLISLRDDTRYHCRGTYTCDQELQPTFASTKLHRYHQLQQPFGPANDQRCWLVIVETRVCYWTPRYSRSMARIMPTIIHMKHA